MIYSAEQVSTISEHKFAYLLLKEEANILHIFLNRPDSKNAFNEILLNELAFAFSYAHYNHNVWAIVLGATGDVWCAGADLRTFQGHKDTSSQSTIPFPSEEIIPGDLFHQVHKPCIARVHASVFAGGFMLVCGCHYVVATKKVFFSLPEVKRGIFPFQVMASLVEIMPYRKALDLCILGKTIDASEAFNLGLVTHLIESEKELDISIKSLTNKICENSPSALRLGLKAFEEVREQKPSEHHRYLFSKLMELIKTDDAREGMLAFREKRKPVWKGK